MIAFTVDTDIARPVAEVFVHATDPAKLATWQTNTVSAVREDEGPMRVGSRLREVHRAPGGRQAASVVEITEYEQDRVFALRIVEGPLPIDARMTFAPIPAGTRVSFSAQGRLKGPLRIAQPLLARVLRRQFARDCARLKQVLEAGPAR